MKITFIFDYNPFLVSSAAAQRYSAVMEEMALNGTIVHLLILSGPDNSSERNIPKNVKIKYYSNFKKDNLFKRRLWNYGLSYLIVQSMIKRVNKDILKIQADMIWYANNYAPLKLLNKTKNLKSKHILEITEYHDLHTYITPDTNLIRRYFFKKEINNFNSALHKLDIILFITENLQNYYSEFLDQNIKTTTFPMIVDHKRFNQMDDSNKSKNEDKVIRYIGSFSNEKDGIDVLIKSFSQLSKEFKDISLELAGGNHADKPMQLELIKSLNLQDKVKYVGMLDKTEIPGYLKGAVMLVLARPNSKQAEGGFPTKLGEYLASGVPVCCTYVGEIPQYLKDKESVFFAEPDSSDSFMQAMKYVLDNPEKAKNVGAKGKMISEDAFGASKQVKGLIEYFKKTIDNN